MALTTARFTRCGGGSKTCPATSSPCPFARFPPLLFLPCLLRLSARLQASRQEGANQVLTSGQSWIGRPGELAPGIGCPQQAHEQEEVARQRARVHHVEAELTNGVHLSVQASPVDGTHLAGGAHKDDTATTTMTRTRTRTGTRTGTKDRDKDEDEDNDDDHCHVCHVCDMVAPSMVCHPLPDLIVSGPRHIIGIRDLQESTNRRLGRAHWRNVCFLAGNSTSRNERDTAKLWIVVVGCKLYIHCHVLPHSGRT